MQPATLKAIWNRLAERYHQAVESVRPDRPASFLPRLEGGGHPQKPAGGNQATASLSLLFHLTKRPDAPAQSRYGLVLRRLQPSLLSDLSSGEEAEERAERKLLDGTAVTPLFRDQDGKPFRFPVSLAASSFRFSTNDNPRLDLLRRITGLQPYFAPGYPEQERRRTPAFLELDWRFDQDGDPAAGGAGSATFRLGAYQLQLAPKWRGGAATSSPVKLWLEAVRGDGPERAGLSDTPVVHATLELRLPLARFSPAGQDPLPSQRGDGALPLLVDLSPDREADAQALMNLLAREVGADDPTQPGSERRQRLRFEVASRQRAVPPVRLIVVDTEPFFVGEVMVPEIAPRDNSTGLRQRSRPASVWRQRAITTDAVNSRLTVRRSVAESCWTVPPARRRPVTTSATTFECKRRSARLISM